MESNVVSTTENEPQNANVMGFIGRELFDHKTSKLNRECIVVKTADYRSEDGAHHKYTIEVFPFNAEPGAEPVHTVQLEFQNGPLAEVGANGITEQALIAIVLDRFRSFNSGPYGCRENSIMITKLEEALLWGQKRANDRAMRNVEGVRAK